MAFLYVIESAQKLGYSQGCLTSTNLHNGSTTEIPFSQVDGIAVYGNPQLSTQLVRECLSSNKPVLYYSEDGHYFGMLESFDFIDPERQKRQMYLTDNQDFRLAWSKVIIEAKIRNSLAFLQRGQDYYCFEESDLHGLQHSLASLSQADSVEVAMGFEGNAAKSYFACLSKLLNDNRFVFQGRSARPPKDPVNSVLSYGYSLLYRSIIGAIEQCGLHPYFAFMHSIQHGHAALASDLIEEYRAFLVDRPTIALFNSGEVEPDDFYKNQAGAIYMTKSLMRRVTNMFSDARADAWCYYASEGDNRRYTFQTMMGRKINIVLDVIMTGDPSRYHPFIWTEDVR